MTQVMSVFAELERKLIGERTKAALAVKRAQGIRLGRPRQLTSEVVERIVGDRSDGMSWSAIARGLSTKKECQPLRAARSGIPPQLRMWHLRLTPHHLGRERFSA